MLYEEKLAIANAYLEKKAGLGWNNFSDINSLHDCDTQEDIFAACDERLIEDGYPDELLEDDEFLEDDDVEEDNLEEDDDIDEAIVHSDQY